MGRYEPDRPLRGSPTIWLHACHTVETHLLYTATGADLAKATGELRTEMATAMGDLLTDFAEGLGGVKNEVATRAGSVETKMEPSFTVQLRWIIGTLIGAIGTAATIVWAVPILSWP